MALPKSLSIATRMDTKILSELKKLFPKETPSQILRHLAEERIAIQRNIDSFRAARKLLAGKKINRDLL